MMGSDRQLVGRIESLEKEVEEQRLLLRCALNRFDGEPEEPYQKSEPEKPVEAQVPTTARWFGKGLVEQESLEKPAAEKDAVEERLGSFGALAGRLRLRGWEWWLNKVGIGLLLFGVVFLFKFSVDQGWLVPEVRVGIGLSLGAVLVWFGLRVYEERRAFSQVVLGGGIGTFYITGFAAFQLYVLVPYALAFLFLIVVTLLAFALSIRQDQVALSMIGAAGGFGTPFLLYDGSGGLGGLVLYATLIMTGIAAIYLYKGWRSLLFFSAVGIWLVLLAGYTQAADGTLSSGLPFLQAGALFAGLVLWLVPVAREVLRRHRPDRWPVPEPGNMVRSLLDGAEKALHPGFPAHLLSVVLPFVGLAFAQEIWDLQKQPLGWVAFGTAAVYAGVSGTLRRIEGEGSLSYTNALTALLLVTLGVLLVLEGNALFFTLVAEAAVLHLVSRRLPDKFVSALAHSLFLLIGIWLSGRIFSGIDEILFSVTADAPFLNVDAVLDLTVVALAFGFSAIFDSRHAARIYRILAHGALLGLIFREFIALPGGDTITLLAWAAYALALALLSRNYPLWGTEIGSHALWTVVGLWLVGRLAWGLGGFEHMAFLNLPAVADLGVICLALLTSTLLSTGKIAITYRILAHAAILAWLWRELGTFPDGAAYVTVSWCIYAAGMLVLGLRRSSAGLVRAGILTLFLVVGKLFLVDLVWVDAIWRIFLFLGLGGLFLILSYYLQTLWRLRDYDRTKKDSPVTLSRGG